MLCALVCTVPLILICGTIAPLRGESGLVIFADDFVATFQFKEDATRFLEAVKERFALFGLELEPSKTRLVEFGRFAEENRKKRGEGKPETFDFLGFTHYCSRSHKTGKFRMKRKTAQKKYRMKLKEMNTWIKQNRHRRLKDLTSRLNLKLRGHYQYYGITDNSKRSPKTSRPLPMMILCAKCCIWHPQKLSNTGLPVVEIGIKLLAS